MERELNQNPRFCERCVVIDTDTTYSYTQSMRMGRPPKPRSKVRSLVIPVRFTKAQWRELQNRSKGQGLPVSEYIRRKLDLPRED
jgi:hypothetical protein